MQRHTQDSSIDKLLNNEEIVSRSKIYVHFVMVEKNDFNFIFLKTILMRIYSKRNKVISNSFILNLKNNFDIRYFRYLMLKILTW